MSIHYIARRPLKVGDRIVEEGEIVPEAVTWRDVQTYVANGSLAVGVDVAPEAVENAELKGRVATLEVRVAALEAFIAGTGQDLTVETITDMEFEVDLIDDHFDANDLRSWTREQLNGVAEAQGIENPGEFDTEELIAQLVEIPVKVPANDDITGDGTDATGKDEPVNPFTQPKPIDMGALERLTRDELDAEAVKLGVTDAPKLGSKGAVVAAVRELLAKRAADNGGTSS